MARNTIVLKGSPRYDEGRAGGAITPGHLIKHHTDGTLLVHATSGGACEATFAVEASLEGGTIDDAYAATDLVPFVRAKDGDVINALIAVSQTIAIGSPLASAGNGQLKLAAAGNNIVAKANVAVTTDGSTVARLSVTVQRGYVSA